MNRIFRIVFVLFAFALIGCNPESRPGVESEDMTTKSYKESDEVILNPERGFHVGKDFYYATASPLTKGYIKMQRKLGRTLFYTGYYLTDYMESDIAPDYLDMIRKNMAVLREHGGKCILRFAYKTDMYETGHPWDASPEWVARHIQQLKPIMQEYGDVILCLQAGFVGVWGEWAFTDHFVSGPKTPEEHALRKKVMVDLLDAMPKDRQIALRTPMFKKNMFLESYSDTLTIETAFSGSDVSRICGHNDCFGADRSDMGTFVGKLTRDFWKSETRYVLMGGETCQVSNYCLCAQSLKDMEDYHWTYLNSGYHSGVYERWKTDGCFDEVEKRLGYRLSLKEVSHTAVPQAGKDFRVVMTIRNTGFAGPANPRAVELVLVDGSDNETVYELNDLDPRYWFAGKEHVIDRTIVIPEDASGECRLYLNLPDPEPTLHDNPLFSIRLANDGIWNEDKGYNRLTTFTL